MEEKILDQLNKAIKNYAELQLYLTILPDNLLEGAHKAYESEIPDSINQILEFLNRINEKNIFPNQASVIEARDLFSNEAHKLNIALSKVPENRNIIGWTQNKNYSAKELLDNMIFYLSSSCDIINTVLIAGRSTKEIRNL